MKNYYILEGNMYVIEDEIYKLFENQHITPTKSELLKVEELIKNTNKDIFSSPRLNEIAKKNNELYKIDVLPDILGRMEKFIGVLGEEYIASFYKNLETVKFKFDVPMNLFHIIPEEVMTLEIMLFEFVPILFIYLEE